MADNVVGWVSGPTERGTLTLVWSCVITIFACTWTVLHLNVPGYNDKPLTVALRKIKWMVINILFPEFVFSKAVCDLRLALEELREFDDYLQRHRKTIKWKTREYGDGNHITQWTWEIAYPDGWSVLYDLLRLDRPHPLKLPAEDAQVDGSILESGGTIDDGHTTNSRYTPFLEPATVPPIIQGSETTPTRNITQKWTVVHSYYAQMGGLATYPDPNRPTCIITASHLTERFKWHHENIGHPLMHLVLGKDDIQDKSKADWLLKSLAVLQVTWIIINVVVRHTTGLPISQIEIATVAFAIMAVLIYLANWWKPKDISQPTALHFYRYGSRSDDLRNRKQSFTERIDDLRNRKQSFTERILSPSEAIERAERGVSGQYGRVANDVLWLEGDIPLLFYLMAGSSFIFGALHCLAWNFEFPTRVELICWRIASLASAILPVVTLAISTILGHLVASKFSQRNINPRFSAAFARILPDEPRQLLLWPTFRNCSEEALCEFASMPKPRNWESLIGSAGRITVALETCDHLLELAETLSWIYPPETNSVAHSWKDKVQRAKKGKELLQDPDVFQLWRDYEGFVMRKYHLSTRFPSARDAGPVTTYLYQILDKVEKISTSVVTSQKWAERASRLFSITSFISYAAARLIILVLCFTSLRAAPAGLYQDNAWTRFLPKIS